MVQIYVEGNDDKKFINHITQNFQSDSTLHEIIDVGGYTNLPKQKNKLQRNTDQGGTNLVVFDADYQDTEGGFEARMGFLQQQKSMLQIEFESFLFPNNRDDGTLETLLLKLMNPEHKNVLNCFEGYEHCLEQINNDKNAVYQLPDLKAKVYAMVEAFPVSRAEEEKRKKHGSYDDQRIWNLNQEAIHPFKAFLSKHLEPGY